jgi:hypothetical protein
VTRTLAVVGLHETYRPLLEQMGKVHDFEVVPVLTGDRVLHAASYDIDELLQAAEDDVADLDVDGITSYWDFPSSCIAAIIAEERGLPTPGLAAVAAFEHKYWSRLLQAEVAPDDTPGFAAVDVYAEGHLDDPPLPYPFWLKPIKAYASQLGFYVDGPEVLEDALGQMRRKIGRLGSPFQKVLGRLDDLPEKVAMVPGDWAIAEGIIEGHQCTVEGHVHDGEVSLHGVFDIRRADNGSTFTDYVYPSQLPEGQRMRMQTISTDLLAAARFDNAPFNIEFFVDDDADRTWVLEVNPRISREHANLMQWVDGSTNLQVMAQTALGEEADLERGDGSSATARKHFHRRWEDGFVEHVPTRDEVAAIEERHAPCVIELVAEAGKRLSQIEDQEPYSYELADLYLAGASEEDVEEKRRAVVDELDIRFAAD